METEPPKGWRLVTERDHSEWVSLQPAGTVVVYTHEEDEDIYLVYRQKEGGRFWYAVDVKTNDYHISDTVEEAIASLNGWMLAAEVKRMYGDAHEYMRKYTRKHGEGGASFANRGKRGRGAMDCQQWRNQGLWGVCESRVAGADGDA